MYIHIQPAESFYCWLYEFDFRADQLVLDSQFGFSILGKTNFPSLRKSLAVYWSSSRGRVLQDFLLLF